MKTHKFFFPNSLLYYFLILFLYIFFTQHTCFAQSFFNVQNNSVFNEIDITHEVKKISKGIIRPTFDSSSTLLNFEIASVKIVNNTRDGYGLYIKSENNGMFVPNSYENGETEIPFNLSTEAIGYIDDTILIPSIIYKSELEHGNFIPILEITNQDTPSDLRINILMNILDSNNQLQMAGHYSSTLTIQYVDF